MYYNIATNDALDLIKALAKNKAKNVHYHYTVGDIKAEFNKPKVGEYQLKSAKIETKLTTTLHMDGDVSSEFNLKVWFNGRKVVNKNFYSDKESIKNLLDTLLDVYWEHKTRQERLVDEMLSKVKEQFSNKVSCTTPQIK